VGKSQMEYSEDLEASRSQSKSDNGRIERVELTAEDVCGICKYWLDIANLFLIGQIDLSKDGQSYPLDSRLGVLPSGMFCDSFADSYANKHFADSRQVSPRLRLDFWTSGRHTPRWKPILLRWVYRGNGTACVATILLGLDRQGPSSNTHACVDIGMGACTNKYGGMHKLSRSFGHTVLFGVVRGGLLASLLCHHKPVVQTFRTTY